MSLLQHSYCAILDFGTIYYYLCIKQVDDVNIQQQQHLMVSKFMQVLSGTYQQIEDGACFVLGVFS